MRYFWHGIIAIVGLALVVFIFFIFSVRVRDNISFTDDQPAVTAPEVTIADPATGPSDAAVTLVNFGDYQCGACADLEADLIALAAEFPDTLRIVWKDLPNTSMHDQALPAAIAARCAEKQDMFWEYHAYLFANQASLGTELYTALATELDLREGTFTRCLENQDTLPLVQRTYDEGIALNITATPTVFINGERFTGDLSLSELRGAVREALVEL